MGVHDCNLSRVAVNAGERGVLTAVEAGKDLPFEPRRVFFLSDVPPGAERGDHAHRLQSQALFCLNGAVQVVLEDGKETRKLELRADGSILVIEPMIWVRLFEFSRGAMVAVFLSDSFDPDEHVRDPAEFKSLTNP